MADQPARATAKVCPLNYLLSGEYVTQEGWQPNFVKVGSEHYIRVNIMGLVVQKLNQNTFYVDDGTSSIQIIDFVQQMSTKKLSVGDPVLVIGRPRNSDQGIFVAAEIVTSKQLVNEPEWLQNRRSFLESFSKPKSESVQVSSNLTGDDVLDFMRKKDTGDGVNIEEIISYFGEDVNEMINTLLSMGEVYEIRSGVLKVLE